MACGAPRTADLNLAGAVRLFESRLARNRVDADAVSVPSVPPKRRQTLQIRVPPGVNLDAVAEVNYASYHEDYTGGAQNLSIYTDRLSRLRRQLRTTEANFHRAETVLARLDARHARARKLVEQEFKIDYEDRLHKYIALLRDAHDALIPDTVLGLSTPSPATSTPLSLSVATSNSRPVPQTDGRAKIDTTAHLALFGRNQLGATDEYVDLKKSFLFIGNDIGTGVALGRADRLADEIGNRRMQVNLRGLSIASALKSLGRSLGLALYLSPGVETMTAPVQLDISEADGLDILDILIDNYALALAYDRKMEIARVYTHDEFATRIQSALVSAQAHNQRARHHKEMDQLRADEANLRRVYEVYYQNSTATGRHKSLHNDAILEYGDSPTVGTAIVEFKKQALLNERRLEEMDEMHHATRATPAKELEILQFALDDLRAREKVLTVDIARHQQTGNIPATARTTVGSTPDIDFSKTQIIRDMRLATKEPIYTERFLVFNSEGGHSCGPNSTETMSRSEQIGDNLTTYFDQLYPMPSRTDRAADEANTAEVNLIAVENTVAGINDADFGRPHITPVGNALIVTGFKRDIEMASSIIEEIDRPTKQVLVEVFMVSVVKDWQRKLQSRITQGVRTANKADSDVIGLEDTDQINIGRTIAGLASGGLLGIGGMLGFTNNAAQDNSFLVRDFRLGLDWTIDFMERNALARKISSPTILALDGCEAAINKTQKRYIEVERTSQPVVNANTAIPGAVNTEFVEREAPLKLTVTPTINPLNDHVKLAVYFQDKIFTSDVENSPEVENIIDTQFIAAPGDVIVLAGLYSEDNSRVREGFPGTTKLPFLTHILGSNSDQRIGEEMVIFLAPTVITPKAGQVPANAASYYYPPETQHSSKNYFKGYATPSQ